MPEHEPGPGEPERGELQEGELERRLRNLTWPAPPPEVKERCLEEILKRAGIQRNEDSAAQPGDEPAEGDAAGEGEERAGGDPADEPANETSSS